MTRAHLLAACAATLLLASPAMAKPIKVGVTLSRFEHLFLIKVHDAIQQQARAMGDVEVQFEDAQGDLARGETVEPFVLIPYELVTPENMQSYVNR